MDEFEFFDIDPVTLCEVSEDTESGVKEEDLILLLNGSKGKDHKVSYNPEKQSKKQKYDEASEKQYKKQKCDEESPKNFLCDECDYTTDKNWNLILHQKDVHLKVSNECSYCNKQVIHLKEHIESMHENPRSYKCEHCDYRANKSDGLRKHIRRMHDDSVVKYKCPVCFKKCLDLENHIKHVHENPEHKERSDKCDDCEYTATSRSSLLGHIGQIHKVQFWVCPECNQQMNKMNKSGHLRTHKDKAFSCSPCEKSFRTRLIFARHILYTHKKHRNKCDYCKKDVTNLKFHVESAHKEVDSSTIDISLDVQMLQKIKLILGLTQVYNGEIDQVSSEKIVHSKRLSDIDDNIDKEEPKVKTEKHEISDMDATSELEDMFDKDSFIFNAV